MPGSTTRLILIPPPGSKLKFYDGKRSRADQPNAEGNVPPGFIDAMRVREEVYVVEQHVPLENELDDDDERSWHWVAYAGTEPVGTIRLVTPPHAEHPSGGFGTAVHDAREPYVKLGRLAVVKGFRGSGVSRELVEAALRFVGESTELRQSNGSGDVDDAGGDGDGSIEFRGLVLVHSQTGVQKVWRKYGFVTDENMGEWDEEGIMHVGMWLRVKDEVRS